MAEPARPAEARIVTLTLNPCIDVSCSTEVVRPVHKVRTVDQRCDPGGGGLNVAKVVNELGGRSTAVYLAGGATGQVLDELIARSGVEGRRVPIAGDTRISNMVFERSTGLEYRFVAEGPLVDAAECRACLALLESLEIRWLVASGSLPRGVPADFYVQVGEIVRAKGGRLVIDSSGEPLRAALGHGVTLAKPSVRELEEVVGRPLPDDASRRAAIQELIRSGTAELLAVTLGEEGALLGASDGIRYLPSPRVERRSAVGAGDSFVAAMTLGIAEGRSVDDAFALAVAAGAAAVMTPATELCHRSDVEQLYEQLRLAA